MTGPEFDPLVHRAMEELRRLPSFDPAAVQRVVRAAATARVTPADEPVARALRARRRWTVTIGLAAAAAIVGFVVGGAFIGGRPAPTTTSVALAPQPAPMREAATSAADVTLVPQQFVLENRAARRVSVVGDFNTWNPASAPMTRSSDGSLWSAIVPLTPGRHVYGFMVDDSVFVLDPRVSKVRDPDLGKESSVLIVGRP